MLQKYNAGRGLTRTAAKAAAAKSKEMQEIAVAWLDCRARRRMPPMMLTMISAMEYLERHGFEVRVE